MRKKRTMFMIVLVVFLVFFCASGAMAAPKGVWRQNSKGQWTYSVQQKRVTGWERIDDTWYYFSGEGIMQTGWVLDNKYWYYLRDNGAMAAGWVQDHGKWYYLRDNGSMATGWIQETVNQIRNNVKWYYLSDSGAMKTGWLWDQGVWYFLNTGGDMHTGWKRDKGKWYFLQQNGAMAIGWMEAGSKQYYLDASGAMHTGWITYQDANYFLSADGSMRQGWIHSDGYRYFLDQTGRLLTGNVHIGGADVNLGSDGRIPESVNWQDLYWEIIENRKPAQEEPVRMIYQIADVNQDGIPEMISAVGQGAHVDWTDLQIFYIDTADMTVRSMKVETQMICTHNGIEPFYNRRTGEVVWMLNYMDEDAYYYNFVMEPADNIRGVDMHLFHFNESRAWTDTIMQTGEINYRARPLTDSEHDILQNMHKEYVPLNIANRVIDIGPEAFGEWSEDMRQAKTILYAFSQ